MTFTIPDGHPKERRWPFFTAAFVCLAVFALLVLLPIPWQDQAVLGAALFVVGLVMHRMSRSPQVTLALMVLSIFCSTRYFLWRVMETWRYWSVAGAGGMEPDAVFVLLLLGAEAYAFTILMLGHFQGIRPLQRQPVPMPPEIGRWPTVDIFVTTYNEPLDVVRPTVLGARAIDWPADKLRVHILDDGRRLDFQELARQTGTGYFSRNDNKHAKAGNINNALRQTSGELVVILDCDHVPIRSFLQMTVGWFLRDSRLAMLQTPHHFYSPDAFERNLKTFRRVPNEGSLFYGVVQDGNDLWNAAFFCGSAAVIRRSALDDVGGVAVETVTEDAHTSLRLQRRGWNTAYLRIPLIGGLATATIADHIGQRIRWARGMVQILRLENPLFARGLTLPQRLCYFNCMIHFLYALPRLIFLTSPLVYLLLDKNNVYGYVFAILAYTFPHLAMAILTNSRVHGRFRHSFWNEVYETVLSPFILLPTLAALLNPRWGRFNVTPKGKSVPKSYLDWRVAAPFVLLLGLNVAGTAVGIRRLWTGTEVFGTVAANVLWTIINTFILGTAVAACYERRQLRTTNRIDTVLPARIILPDGRSLAAETRNLSLGGAALAYGQPAALQTGESIRVAIGEAQVQCTLPATVVAHRSPIVRVAFEELTLRQHDGLTRQLFGRADTWLRWNEECEIDRPLVSFFRIARISVLGLIIAVAQPFLILRGLAEGTPPFGRRRWATPMLLLLVTALLLAWRASAQPHNSKEAPLPVFHDTIELGRPAQRETLVLKGLTGQSSTQFSISLTKIPLHARLFLQYTPSPRLDADSSTLAISLNGSPAVNMAVRHSNNPGLRVETELELPGDLLMNENTISFALSGKCLSCSSAAAAAELRTWIEPSSRIEVSGTVLPSPNDTRLLPSPFFDPAQRQPVSLSFFFPAAPDKETLGAAAVTASWFGSMANARTLHFRASVQHFPAGNVVAFLRPGTEATHWLGLDGKTGPAVALRDNPSDPAGKVLAVLGATPEQMRTAATALAANRLQAHGDFVAIQSAAAPPPRQAYDAPRWASSDRILPLVPDKPGDDQTAYGDGVVRVYFRLPPDLYYGAQTSVPLGVAFQYSELRGRSALAQVRVNGLLVGTIRVKPDQDDDPVSRVLPVPVSALYPRNTLSVEFTAQPGEIVPRATLLPGTWLDIRGVPHFTRLPRLDLFVKAGFPFTRMADLGDTAIVVPEKPSAVEIGLLLDLSAFLAEQTGYPGLRVTVAHAADRGSQADRDLLVIGGTVTDAPLSTWADVMPLLLGRSGFQLPAPRTLLERLSAQTWTAEGRARGDLARQLRRKEQPDAAIVGFASPLAAGRAVVAVAAAKPEAMQSIVESLNRATSQDLFESSVLLQLNGELRAYAVAAPITHSGRLSWVGGFNYWTHRYLAAAPLVILAGMFVVAAVLRRQLEARARRRIEVA